MSMRSFLTLLASVPSLVFAGCNAGNETMTGKGIDYRGCRNQTITGRTCQPWTSQTPHKHTHGGKVVLAGMGDDNYCRNPDDSDSIWCYTTDPNSRWGYCTPIGVSMTTECETISCSASFADMDSSGKRESC